MITDMSQPLAPALGNGLEVAEAMRVLTGQTHGRLFDLSVALGGQALVLGGLADTPKAAEAQIQAALSDGRAADRFARMLADMGGPKDFAEHWQDHLPSAPVIRDLPAPHAGYVTAMDGEAMGLAVIALGGGRQVERDIINPAVGLDRVAPLGAYREKGDPLLRIHAATPEQADRATKALLNAITITDEAAPVPPLILNQVPG